jgi:hypothetical protein
VLPDGQWYGIAAGVTIDQLDFDLACWFSGAAAEAAAAADGAESPPPNDYHVRNTVETTRALHPAAGTPVVWYPEIGSPGSETGTTYAAWVDTDPERPRPGIWITIENGEVTAIAEQWVP